MAFGVLSEVVWQVHLPFYISTDLFQDWSSGAQDCGIGLGNIDAALEFL